MRPKIEFNLFNSIPLSNIYFIHEYSSRISSFNYKFVLQMYIVSQYIQIDKYAYTVWTVKFVLNWVFQCFLFQKLVNNTKEFLPKPAGLKFHGVVDHFIDKTRVENTKFKTNLTVQVVPSQNQDFDFQCTQLSIGCTKGGK